MPLWTYQAPPEIPDSAPVGSIVVKDEVGWILVRPDLTRETLVFIGRTNQKHDLSVTNFEYEDGSNIILEDNTIGNYYLLLEQS